MEKQLSIGIRGVSLLVGVGVLLVGGALGVPVLAQAPTISVTAQATQSSFSWRSMSGQGFKVQVDVQNLGAAPIQFGDTLIVWQASSDAAKLSGEAFVEGDFSVADARAARDKKRYLVDSFRGVQPNGWVTLTTMNTTPGGAVEFTALTTQLCQLKVPGNLIGLVAPGAISGFQCDVPLTPLPAPEQASAIWIAFPEMVETQTQRKLILFLEGTMQPGVSLVRLTPRFIVADSPTLRIEAAGSALPIKLVALAKLSEIEGNDARAFLQERFGREPAELLQAAIIADLARLKDDAPITAWLLEKLGSLAGPPYREALAVLVQKRPIGLTSLLVKQLEREIEPRNIDSLLATLDGLALIRDGVTVKAVEDFRDRVKKSRLDSRTRKMIDDAGKQAIRSMGRKN